MNKIDLYPAQRKTCRALATIPAEILEPKLAKEMVLTPLNILGEIRNRVDINVKVQGGGFMGQAFASAVAISRALTGEGKGGRDPKDHPLTKSMREEVRRKIMEFDRHLLSGDPRQTESKKFGGPGARRRKQKSYR